MADHIESGPGGFSIQLAEPDAAAEIYHLFRQHGYVSSDLDEAAFAECWRHQFFGSPAGSGCVFLVRDAGGRLVGHYGVLPFPYSVDGAGLCGGFVCQLFVHPDLRQTTLFFDLENTILTRYREFGIAFVYGLVTIQKVLRAHLRLGFARGSNLHIYCLPLAPGRGLRAIRPKTPAFLVRALDAVGNLACRAALVACALRNRFAVEELTSLDSLDPELMARCRPAAGIFAQRTPETYRSRFRPFGGKRYRIFAAVSEGRHQGYLVLRRTEVHGLDVMAIIDVLAPPSGEAARSLLLHAAWLGASAGCDAVAYVARPDSAGARLLRSCFFWRTPAHFTLIAGRESAVATSGPGWAERWHTTWFDHDFI